MLLSVMVLDSLLQRQPLPFTRYTFHFDQDKNKNEEIVSCKKKTDFFLYPVKTTMLLKLAKATHLGARPLRNQEVHVRYDIDTIGNLVFPNPNLKNHSGGGGWGLELSPY
jgi:hypothetical protein